MRRNVVASGISVFASLVLLVVSGCGDSATAPPPPEAIPPTPPPDAIAVRTLFAGPGPFRADPVQETIRTEAEWRALWTSFGPRGPVPLPLPQVDFATEVVVFASREAGGGCDGIDIPWAVREGEDVRVAVVETRPGPACVCPLIGYTAVEAAAVDKPRGSVRFEVTRRLHSCG